jgi:hypothetical protein
MSDLFTIKRTFRLPSQELTLSSGAAFDLTTADLIEFVYKLKGSSDAPTRLTCTAIDATHVRVDFGANDVLVVGAYQFQIEATFSGVAMPFPTKNFYTFSITPNLGDAP